MKGNVDRKTLKALEATRESKHIEFKIKLDPNSNSEWCELIKDIVAIANSGGGIILIGLNDKGQPSGENVTPILEFDSARITDKIAKYTGEQFDGFNIEKYEKRNHAIALFRIDSTTIPMLFIQPGTYDAGNGKQISAFSKGAVYFRHGAKSEPGTGKDLRDSMERELERRRKGWLGNVRKVINAPADHEIRILPPEVVESKSAAATPIRIVNDLNAPAYRKIDPDATHPFRQIDAVREINKRLGENSKITPYDIQSIRRSLSYRIESELFL